MATANQTARQKFIEARKSGVDPVTARKQAYGEVAPAQSGGIVQAQPTTAPVAGQPPAITPTPTPATPTTPTQGSFNEQTQGMNVAERQAVRQAPNTPTPVPETTTTPTTPATPETPTPTAPVDKTAEIKAQTEAKLVENQQKAQLEEAKRQTIAQETAKASVPTSQQDILNQMISGVGVKPQKTNEFRSAQFQFNKFNKLNAMTPSQLTTSLKNGDISTDMDRLLSSNPNYVQAKQKYEEEKKIDTLNKSMGLLNKSMSGVVKEEVDPMQALADKIIKSLNITDKTYEDAYATYVSKNPNIVKYTEQLSGINKDIAQTTQRITDGYKAFSEEKGDMPAGAYILYAQNQMSEATDYLNALNNTKTYLEADLKMAMEMGKDQYDAVSKDIDNALNQRNAVISQAIQQQFSIAGKQAEADLAKKVAKESLNDPATAIANVMKTYQEMGIPFTQSIQTKVADAEDYIANGGDLAGYLDKMIKDIQAKPEYKAMQAQALNKDVQFQTYGNKVYKVQNGQLLDTGITIPKDNQFGVIGYDASGKAQYGFVNTQTNHVTPYGATIGSVTPTGTLQQITLGNKTVTLDSVATSAITSAFDEIKSTGQNLIVGEGHRDQVATIKSMAERYGIPFNASNPAETAKQLTAAGHTVAAPGLSKHETGMAIDLYSDGMKAPTPEQVKILNSKGWYQTAGANDMGHFEYLGVQGTGATGTQVSQASLPLYRAYMEDGKLPSKDALKGLGMTSEQFVDSAQTGYDAFLASKAKEINETYPTLQVQFTPSYGSLSATQKEKLNESMTKIGDIDQRLEKLKKLFVENGTEVLPTKAKKEMQTLKQQIILKAKEVENLGVLNGPDLGILESLIPETTGIMSGLFSFDDNTLTTLNSIQLNYRSDAKTKGINYGAKISFKEDGVQPSQPQQTAPAPQQTNTGAGQTNQVTGKQTYTW